MAVIAFLGNFARHYERTVLSLPGGCFSASDFCRTPWATVAVGRRGSMEDGWSFGSDTTVYPCFTAAIPYLPQSFVARSIRPFGLGHELLEEFGQ